MHTILVTGATGTVGREVISHLHLHHPYGSVIAGVRSPEAEKNTFGASIRLRHFDFEAAATYAPAMEGCSVLFLLRPPQITAVQKIFAPLISAAKDCGVQHIIFLSVQGVERSRIIPHHKIEQQIIHSGLRYTFLRPAYFMQNFTGMLLPDLVEKKRIFLPAGSALFTVVDVRDVGAVAAKVIATLPEHTNKAYELTSASRYTFAQMADILTAGLGYKISYTSPGLFQFFFTKRKEGVAAAFVLVMLLLHYLPRFQKPPALTTCVPVLLGRPAHTFPEFVAAFRKILTGEPAVGTAV